MNILPKKRWHVRNKDNVARVRRDEQKAKEEAQEAERRKHFAEQEAKVELLRKRLPQKEGEDKHESSEITHFNFFKEFEQESKAAVKSNKDYEKEKKAEKEDFEKRIGLLTYLGQSVTKEKDKSPWYLKQEKANKTEDDVSVDQIDERKKMRMDPVHDIHKYLKEKSKHKEKNNKRRKKKKHRELTTDLSSSKPTIEELRAKRLEREKEERRRTDILLGKITANTDRNIKDQHDPNRYSSQFNPDLARQRK